MKAKHMFLNFKRFLLIISSFAIGCGSRTPDLAKTREAWDEVNNPIRIGDGYVTKFSELPVAGALQATPWSDDYWPSNQGGIARRWKLDNSNAFTYRSPSLEELRQATTAQLARMSPAEKLDVFLGDYSYPTVQFERSRVSPENEHWEGICHGWAAAALNFDEPKPVLMSNADGIQIPFGAADIKALLSYFQGNVGRTTGGFLGARCNVDLEQSPQDARNPECRDTNAGSFHLVLTNEIGIRKKGFIADLTRDRMVWNQPVHGYSSRIVTKQAPSPGAAAGTVIEHLVETTITYTAEIEPEWSSVVGTEAQNNASVSYLYRLELNAEGEIIGGAWSVSDRPDFLWTQSRPVFFGRWRALERIYNASIASEPYADPTLLPMASVDLNENNTGSNE